jgi:hypothetical protein
MWFYMKYIVKNQRWRIPMSMDCTYPNTSSTYDRLRSTSSLNRRPLTSSYQITIRFNPFSARFKIITLATLPNYTTSYDVSAPNKLNRSDVAQFILFDGPMQTGLIPPLILKYVFQAMKVRCHVYVYQCL